MARPIKDTPVLTGKDARRFEENIRANEGKKVPREQYQRALKAYNNFKRPG